MDHSSSTYENPRAIEFASGYTGFSTEPCLSLDLLSGSFHAVSTCLDKNSSSCCYAILFPKGPGDEDISLCSNAPHPFQSNLAKDVHMFT